MKVWSAYSGGLLDLDVDTVPVSRLAKGENLKKGKANKPYAYLSGPGVYDGENGEPLQHYKLRGAD